MSQPRYNTLDVTIRRALGGQGFEDKRYYAQAFINARRWYETEYVGGGEFAYGHRTTRLRVEVDRTAALPDDYVEWDMVGVRRGNVLVNLLSNPALVVLPDRVTAAAAAAVAGSAQAVGVDSYCYQYTGCWDELGVACLMGYGLPTYGPGEFTVLRAERQLLVSSRVAPGTELYLHYLSQDAPCAEGTQIHPLAEAWLEFYVLGFLYQKTNPALAVDYERRAERARVDYLLKRSGFQIDDVYAGMAQSLRWRT